MKTQEELKTLKEEVETMSRKLADLNEEELAQVSGGNENTFVQTLMKCDACGYKETWDGYYMDGKYYHCPSCYENKLRGIMAWD